MSSLFDHEIIEQLHSGPRSLVWRAKAADGTALIVKVPNQQFPSFQQVANFKREYASARRCRHPGVVQPLALRQHGGRWTMLQEDMGGQALDQVLRAQLAVRQAPSHSALALDDFFDIALQLCAALEAVHLQGMMHKDINPANLVWNGDTRVLQLIDFGVACELVSEQQDAVAARVGAGRFFRHRAATVRRAGRGPSPGRDPQGHQSLQSGVEWRAAPAAADRFRHRL